MALLRTKKDKQEAIRSVLAVLAENVAARRRELGLNQDELAERAQTYRAHISKIEAAQTNVTLDTAARLAKALKLPLAGLFAGPNVACLWEGRGCERKPKRSTAKGPWPGA